MFAINKENLDETRIEKTGNGGEGWPFVDIIGSDHAAATPAAPAADPDATQRVFVTADGSATPTTPQRRDPPATRQRSDAPQRRSNTPTERRSNPPSERRASAAAAKKKKNEQILLISLCALAAILLIAVIIVIVSTVSSRNDDGRIGNNVFAAGVNLSGMTVEQAESALRKATSDTYTQLDMTVQVLDTTVTLSPKNTGAYLNVAALAQAAYDYSRSGSRNDNSAYTVSILPYLTLNTDYIKSAVDKLGQQYSTTLSQTTYSVEGTRPADDPDPATVDVTKTYQTLTIRIGTAEYGLNTDQLYEDILDAYNINIFQVTGECSVVAPDALDCEALYNALCTAPVDASMDPSTYVVTPEVYGYGFTLSDLKTMVTEAAYGSTLTIPMRYITPDITTDILSEDLFKDVLASFQTKTSTDADWNTNMTLACQLLNGVIIKSGETFSFNEIIGEPTTRQGYKAVNMYVGKAMTSLVGGGISQVAGTLYTCALVADLDILERNPHTYVPSYIDLGFDAQIYYGTMDLQLRNNTEQPIRIEAQVANGVVQITLIGTNAKEYTVEVGYEILETRNPGQETITLAEDNPGGYRNGSIISAGIVGYRVATYKYTYDALTGRELDKLLVAETAYAKRNEVVVELKAVEEPATDPGETGTGATEDPSETETTAASDD